MTSTFAAMRRDAAKAEQSAAAHRKPAADSTPRNPRWHRLATGVQTKLTVGPAEDPLEREADQAAERVTTMTDTRSPVPVVRRVCSHCEQEHRSGEDELHRAPSSEGSPRQLQRDPAQTEEEEVSLQRQAEEGEQEQQEEPLRRQAEEGEVEEDEGPVPLYRQVENDEQEEAIPRQAEGGEAFGVPPATERSIDRLRSGGGQPLPGADRAYFEPRFGYDFGHVRIHRNAEAAATARDLRAQAYTVGRDVVFAPGKFAPGTDSGRRLLAHELTHVIQQDGGSPNNSPAAEHGVEVARQPAAEEEAPVFEISEAALESMEEGSKVEQFGVVEPDEGTNLWPQTNREQDKLGLLSMNTRVFVDRELPGGWYSVYVDRHQRGQALDVPARTHGYVAASRVNTEMPDPDAWFFRITTAGQGALALARQLYPDYEADCKLGVAACRDHRYLVNVLTVVNQAANRKYIYKEKPDDDWDEAKTLKGGKIWVPGMTLVNALHGQVSSGSISYEVLETLGDILIGVAAFIVGLLHGALMSLADVFIGVYDLLVLAKDIIVKLFKGTLISDAKAFWETIKQIKASDIIEMVGAKWNHPNTWDRWKFRGYVIGYAIVEILMLVFSGGAITAIKWAGKVGKFGKLASYLSKLARVQRIISRAKGMGGKAVERLRTALKAAHTLSEAHGWAAKALRLPLGILRRLSELDIQKLKKLPQWVRERFARLATDAKLRLLGCTSPCKVDPDKIADALRLAGKGGKSLTTPADVTGMLQRINSKFKIAKISQKLRRSPSALMEAIQKAGLTDADFAKLADFLTPGDLASPAQAYRTFVRYLTNVVPAKTGKDIDKLNDILKAMVKAEKGRGAALKGAMFEQWVALHVPALASRKFGRISFNMWKLTGKLTPPYLRHVDKWVPDKGEIWDMKHQLSKVPKGQADDYAALVGKTAPDGNVVRTVNYLFPTEEAAKMNKELADLYGFGVHYIDSATNKMVRLR